MARMGTVAISKETREKLGKIRRVDERFDDVINRVCTFYVLQQNLKLRGF